MKHELSTENKIIELLKELNDEKLDIIYKYAVYLESQPVLHHDNKNLLNILPYLLKLQNTKEGQYGRSWCKHKDFSAFFNVERKWDRIFNIMSRAMDEGVENTLNNDTKSGTPGETFVDTIVDMGLYSLMWAGLIQEVRPEQFEKFIKNNNLMLPFEG